jgi:REP element-mobilizing transposase RayT
MLAFVGNRDPSLALRACFAGNPSLALRARFVGCSRMSDPLAYFLTWTTYGTWLPGDERGWTRKRAIGVQPPDASRRKAAESRLIQSPVLLDDDQRRTVTGTVVDHCLFRKWHLFVSNCRTNHVHVVVSAPLDPDRVMSQFKSWCSRRLNERGPRRERWWTKDGSTRWINDEESLESAVLYVRDAQ